MPARELTPDERRERGIKLARLIRDRDRLAAEHAEANRSHREETKGLTKEIEALSREVESGFVVEDAQQMLFRDALSALSEDEPAESSDELAREGDDDEEDAHA